MAVLNSRQRDEAVRQLIRRHYVEARRTGDLTKDDLAEALAAIDEFIDSNAGAINNLFPEPFKSTATLGLKASILAYVTMKRGGII